MSENSLIDFIDLKYFVAFRKKECFKKRLMPTYLNFFIGHVVGINPLVFLQDYVFPNQID